MPVTQIVQPKPGKRSQRLQLADSIPIVLRHQDGHRIAGSLTRMHLAAIPCVIFAIAVSVMVGAVLPAGTVPALITVALGGSGALLLYVLFAKALGVTELTDLSSTVGARLRR